MTLSDLRAPVISALRWTAISRLLMQVITWSSTIIAVRLLTPTDFGIVTVAAVVSNYLTLLSDSGFGNAIVQRNVRARATLNAVFSVLLICSIALAGLVFMVAPLVGSAFHEPRATAVMRLMALQFIVLPFGTISDAMLRMDLRFRELGMANIAGAVASAVSVVGLALLGAGPYALVGALLISQAVRVTVMQLCAKTPVAITTALQPIRSLLRYSTLILAERSVWYWYTEADNAIVARLLDTSTLGAFSVAKSVMEAPLDRISQILNVVSFPTYSRIQEHDATLSEAFLKSIRMTSYLVFPLFWGLGAVAEPLVEVAFGGRWRGAILPMQLLSIAMPLRALQTTSTPLMHAIGKPHITLTFVTIAALLMIPSLIIGVMIFGVAGAAGAWAIGYPLLYTLSVWLFTRPLSVKASKVWAVLIRPMASGVLMATMVVLTVYGLLGGARPWLQLVVGVLTGVVSYVVAVLLFDRTAFRELSGLIVSFLRRR